MNTMTCQHSNASATAVVPCGTQQPWECDDCGATWTAVKDHMTVQRREHQEGCQGTKAERALGACGCGLVDYCPSCGATAPRA